MDASPPKATVVSEPGPQQKWEHRNVTSSTSEFTNGTDERVMRASFTRRKKDEYYSPVHRHNFDQTRYVVEGEIDFGHELIARDGDFVYFPASTHYGITVRSEGCLVFTVQTHGPDWAYFPTRAEAGEGTRALQKISEVDREVGVVRWPDGRVQDTYEALWENLTGRPMEYPTPRYTTPCLIRSLGFAWRPTSQKGVRVQTLASFNGVGPAASKLSIDTGASLAPLVAGQHAIMAVLTGLARYGRDQVLKPGAIIHCPAGATLDQLTAENAATLMVIQYAPKMAVADPLSLITQGDMLPLASAGSER